MEGSALLGLRELRALGVEGWHIYFGRGAACQLTSGSCNAAELALTELHASTWQHEHHEVLLSTALRKGKFNKYKSCCDVRCIVCTSADRL